MMKQKSILKGAVLLLGIVLVLVLICISGEFGMLLTEGLLGVGLIMLLFSLISQLCQLGKALINRGHRLYAKDFFLKLMATLMGLSFLVGTGLYLYVFETIEENSIWAGDAIKFSNAEFLFRSLICSLDLFMLDVDGNILDHLKDEPRLKGWLSIQSALSFASTVALLVGLVYSRLHAYYRLNHATKINDDKDHLYLFFGYNEPSELLIKDIMRPENDSKAVAIIIDTANLKDDDNDEWEGIVSLFTHKKKVFKTAENIGARVAIASEQLDDIAGEITSREDFDAFGHLGLSKIKKYIKKLSRTHEPQLHIFFMGDDEELNIRNIIALAKDTTMMWVAQNKELYHRIYCHARYNGPNRVIQDVALKKKLNIKIVDSSHLAVEVLKLDSSHHPVNVVKTSDTNPVTVESPLKTLIVGFGEVGRDAFRFLYEFGAFVNSENENARSPFECIIVDKNLNDIQGTFMSSMPGIFSADNRNIRFIKADYNSTEFYTDVLCKDRLLEDVNYIVISIGNNDEAIALATRIFNQIRRVRQDVSDLRILVRCTDDNKVEGIWKIADHYNYGYGNGEKNSRVIQIFGEPGKTYTYDLVVSDRLIEKGKEFHEEYIKFAGEKESWDARHERLTATVPPNIEELRQLRRKESQDIANALHAGTKMILLKKAMCVLNKDSEIGIDWESFYQRYFNADGSANVKGSRNGIIYPGLSEPENKIILRLAQLEHLRWNAAHELMGYIFNPVSNSCDERTMQHNCLCPWSKLDGQSAKNTGWPCDYKKYDFCVADTTIARNRNTLSSSYPHD